MCRRRDVEPDRSLTMRISVLVICGILCVYEPWAVLAAPLNTAASTDEVISLVNTNQTSASSRPDQANVVDANNAVDVNSNSVNISSTSAFVNKQTTSVSSTDSTTTYTKYGISSKAYEPTQGAVFSTTTSDNALFLPKTTTATTKSVSTTTYGTTGGQTTKEKTTASTPTTLSSVLTTSEDPLVNRPTLAPRTTVRSLGMLDTTTEKVTPQPVIATSAATTTTAVVPTTTADTPSTTTEDPTTGTTVAKRNTNVTTESVTQTSQPDISSTVVTARPVIAGTNTTLAATTTQSFVAGQKQTTVDPITKAITFEVVDPKKLTTPPNATSSTTTIGAAVAANGSQKTSPSDVESSSGDDLSIFIQVSTDRGSNIEDTTQPQTAAFNTTTLDTSIPMNITAVSNNNSVYISTTAKDDLPPPPTITTSTTADTTTSTTVAATETINTTTAVRKTQPPPTQPVDNGSSGKGEEDKTPTDEGSLTTILLVLCASLLALLLALCIFTYVKFRKKSRSIRKRLTFKDDSIYDNPIYHGRWEVPKAPEPTSSSCPRSLPMLVSALPDEVVRLSKDEDTGFHVQFMMLDKLSPNSPRQAATTAMNTHKNRYSDILPFDHSRVKLTEEGDKSDYINASFVPGVKSEREYVAAQGPLERTAADHWRMIWELNIRVIAMLTTCEEGDLIFKAKCCQYWPNKENESVNYDGIYVTLVSTARLCRENYKLKVLHIRKGKDSEPRKVQLFQYIKWPDRKNPDDPEAFLEYRDHVKREMTAFEEQSPLLVHCSAGVGRTGTFIAIDTLLQHMEERESIDVYGLVLRLRKYRVLLVQNANQYKFVHSSLLMQLDKMKKAEVDEGQKKAGLDGSYPYENMVMGQRAVVGELGGLVHGGDNSGAPTQQSSAVQSFLRKTKTNVQTDVQTDDQQCRNSDGMPSPVKIEEWPRPLSDPVPRPVIETPKSKPFSGISKGDPERALAKELGGMFQGGVERNASPGKTAAIKAFLRNRDLESETVPTNSDSNPNGDSLVIDNRFREDGEKQTTCL